MIKQSANGCTCVIKCPFPLNFAVILQVIVWDSLIEHCYPSDASHHLPLIRGEIIVVCFDTNLIMNALTIYYLRKKIKRIPRRMTTVTTPMIKFSKS